MIRTLIGLFLFLAGVVDLWRWGWHILLATPQLIFGIGLVAVGGALVAGGRRSLTP